MIRRLWARLSLDIIIWCLVAFSLSGCYVEPRTSPPFPSRQPRRHRSKHRSASSPRIQKISLSRLHPLWCVNSACIWSRKDQEATIRSP
ncbi:hypothetical protein EDB92DRAFT_1868176 [Lactarius akahatsu]|uniref:Secreted protein n=1 Tax=Lactarius akahatsu TaxID=416441 RepID=A0AAD4LI59_9AGAM|nr:hypothetical protein EDB92DRAFT_1868176 [Lactarius akahatsu]